MRKAVNEFEYIGLINEKMKTHDLYEEGVRIETFPPSSNHPRGTNVTGGLMAIDIDSWAKTQVDREYKLVLTK